MGISTRLKRGSHASCVSLVPGRVTGFQDSLQTRAGTGFASRPAMSPMRFGVERRFPFLARRVLCGQTHTLQGGAIPCIYGRAPTGWPAGTGINPLQTRCGFLSSGA